MKVLVTGAGGMVGSHMVEIMHEEGIDVLGTYYKPTTDISELNPEIKMIECDVRYSASVEKVICDFMPDQIYHLAAQSYPTVSWDRPYETIDTNVNGTVAVFESVKKARLINSEYDPVVVVACSSAEYGATLDRLTEPKVKENAELLPLHPYGVSKVGQDLLSYQYFVSDGIKCIRARIFNTTGTRKVNDVTSDFAKRAVEQEKLGLEKPVLRVGNIETRRAIMDFKDLVNALRLLAEKGQYGEAYNISSERAFQIREIIEAIEEEMGIKFELSVDPKLLRPTDEKIIIGDVTKIKQDTGWTQQVPLKQTVKEMIEYWRKAI
jgi:nucleoside-diphosphate-sugar epimerase